MPSDAALRASLVVIGDEILAGYVRDTNSGWLAERLQQHGVPLERITTVPDEADAIDEALATELARARPRLVVTSGGIGSTPDDLTMEAVARHLGTRLVTQPVIDERITAALERTAARGIEITDALETSMRKMAQVPEGAYLLGAADGVAAGVALDVGGGSRDGGATIVILPGVPGEFRRITCASVEPALLAGQGAPQHVIELRHPYPESALNLALHTVVAQYPDVHLGSYPGWECIVRLKGEPGRVEEAAHVVREAIDELAASPGAADLRASWQAHWERDDSAS